MFTSTHQCILCVLSGHITHQHINVYFNITFAPSPPPRPRSLARSPPVASQFGSSHTSSGYSESQAMGLEPKPPNLPLPYVVPAPSTPNPSRSAIVLASQQQQVTDPQSPPLDLPVNGSISLSPPGSHGFEVPERSSPAVLVEQPSLALSPPEASLVPATTTCSVCVIPGAPSLAGTCTPHC
jgi:hypothetical protein